MEYPIIIDPKGSIDSLKELETIKEIDKCIALFPRIFRALFCKPEIWVNQQEYRVKEASLLLGRKLEQMDPVKIIEPPLHVAFPALNALSYSMDSEELRSMYVNLLANSMNSDISDSVHPAFVETIKQMSPIDARLLKDLSICEFPSFINIQLVGANHAGTEIIFKYLTAFSDNPNSAETISISLSNLQRIGLVEVTTFEWHVDENAYADLMQHPRFLSFKTYPLKEGQTIRPQKGSICITPFGESFIRICL